MTTAAHLTQRCTRCQTLTPWWDLYYLHNGMGICGMCYWRKRP